MRKKKYIFLHTSHICITTYNNYNKRKKCKIQAIKYHYKISIKLMITKNTINSHLQDKK